MENLGLYFIAEYWNTRCINLRITEKEMWWKVNWSTFQMILEPGCFFWMTSTCILHVPFSNQRHLTDSMRNVLSLLQPASAVSFNFLISGRQDRYQHHHAAFHSIQTSQNTRRAVLSNVLLSVDIWATVKHALSAEGGEEQVPLSLLSAVSALAPVMEINEVSGE